MDIIIKIMAQLIVGLSVVWLMKGSGLWFLIPWTIGWAIYSLTY